MSLRIPIRQAAIGRRPDIRVVRFAAAVQPHTTSTSPAIGRPGRTMATQSSKKDWSANQYLKFHDQRTRAVHDLVAQLPFSSSAPPKRVVDLGCGPGNSTAVLQARFPTSHINGVDTSEDMVYKARTTLPEVDFSLGDVRTYAVPEGTDLLFSNAVFQWLRMEERLATIVRLFEGMKAGGVIALQVPDNFNEPSHRLMRETAHSEGPWTKSFTKLAQEQQRPNLDPIETPADIYNALIPHAANVDVWHVVYNHVLHAPRDIVEWVKGTGLQPFLHAMPEGEVQEAYLQEYERRVAEAYPALADGKVLFRFPRLFVVATRK
jgi:trans-aconitate 2-methyltransferase